MGGIDEGILERGELSVWDRIGFQRIAGSCEAEPARRAALEGQSEEEGGRVLTACASQLGDRIGDEKNLVDDLNQAERGKNRLASQKVLGSEGAAGWYCAKGAKGVIPWRFRRV